MKSNNYAVYSSFSEGKMVTSPTLAGVKNWFAKALHIKKISIPRVPKHGGFLKEVRTRGESYTVFKIQHRRSSADVHPNGIINGQPPKPRGRHPFVIPQGLRVNWHKTNREVAKILRCSNMTVIRLRKQLGIESMPRGRPTNS